MADKALCSIPGCDKLACRKGWCSPHYQRWRRHGDPCGGRDPDGAVPGHTIRTDGICAAEGCANIGKYRGLCVAHYKRWLKYGDVNGGSTHWGAAQRFIDDALEWTADDCLSWPFATNPQGAAQIRINKKTLLVTRIICERAHGAPPTPKHQAAHSCGKGHEGCVNPHHLSWKTQTENEADKLMHGTRSPLKPPGAKLTYEQVSEIRRRHSSGAKPKDLARQYRTTTNNIHQICARRTWATI